jgi:hypothetical protein
MLSNTQYFPSKTCIKIVVFFLIIVHICTTLGNTFNLLWRFLFSQKGHSVQMLSYKEQRTIGHRQYASCNKYFLEELKLLQSKITPLWLSSLVHAFILSQQNLNCLDVAFFTFCKYHISIDWTITVFVKILYGLHYIISPV